MTDTSKHSLKNKVPDDAQKVEVEVFDPDRPIVIHDKNGRVHVLSTDDSGLDEETMFQIASNDWLDRHIEKAKEDRSVALSDMKLIDSKIKPNLISTGKLAEAVNTKEIIPAGIKNYDALNRWAQKNRDLVVEIADGHIGAFRRKSTDDIHQSEVYLETAEDDRVIGVPHTIATAGDKIYIINGRVMTGWSMYFSLTAIKSPEDYAKNVDLVYNVPYLYASILLKSQLGLGATYEITYGSDDDLEIPEEKFINNLHFKILKVRRSKMMKTAFHKYTYGNSYWHIRRNKDGLPNKITILQPERMKIFLDPMTTKVLFYIYLPPIIGGTVLVPYPESRTQNPNLLHNMALTYPVPIIMRPEDIIHFKQNAYTEYPFGFSDVRPCIDPAQARLDINLIAPIIFKKYAKPMIHWQLTVSAKEGLPALNNKQISTKISDMISILQNMEPGSDPVTTERWNSMMLNAPTGQNDLLVLTSDLDAQIFAVNGTPETYFKPKGSTDRMIAEQDKTFMGRLQGDREDFEDEVVPKLIEEPIKLMIEQKKLRGISDVDGGKVMDELDKWLLMKDSFMADQPRYPEIQWKEMIKQDETQEIVNTIAKLTNGIIGTKQAAKKLGEDPPEDEFDNELNNAMNGVMNDGDTQGQAGVSGSQQLSALKGGLNISRGFMGASMETADMSSVNRYPVAFESFMKLQGVGTYPINYCILDDRIHMEMPIENSVYVTQKMFGDIADDEGKLDMFKKMRLNKEITVKYYPTDSEVEELMKIDVPLGKRKEETDILDNNPASGGL